MQRMDDTRFLLEKGETLMLERHSVGTASRWDSAEEQHGR
jgi:hypothetical protein